MVLAIEIPTEKKIKSFVAILCMEYKVDKYNEKSFKFQQMVDIIVFLALEYFLFHSPFGEFAHLLY